MPLVHIILGLWGRVHANIGTADTHTRAHGFVSPSRRIRPSRLRIVRTMGKRAVKPACSGIEP